MVLYIAAWQHHIQHRVPARVACKSYWLLAIGVLSGIRIFIFSSLGLIGVSRVTPSLNRRLKLPVAYSKKVKKASSNSVIGSVIFIGVVRHEDPHLAGQHLSIKPVSRMNNWFDDVERKEAISKLLLLDASNDLYVLPV